MRIIARKRLREYAARHADCGGALDAWYQVARAASWKSFADVRRDHPHADLVGNRTVFNIKGNSYRLITAIHYNGGRVYIREILTHAEYDRGDWKER